MSTLLVDLNPQQRRAVQEVSGALLIVAGPGSGKTRVLTRRLAYRVAEGGISSRRILAITFTNRAAKEMQERVRLLLPDTGPVPVGTFHWMCAGLLRRYGDAIGLSRSFRLLSPGEARNVLRSVIISAGAPSAPGIAAYAEGISALKSGVDPARAAALHALQIDRLDWMAERYAERLRSMGVLDLDDLLAHAATLLRTQAAVRGTCVGAIDELLVDEYQDTNPVQQEIVAALAPPNGTVFVVGDEDQSIYGWRHADSRGFERFLLAFPEARVIRLTHTYRHSKHIARLANALIEHNSGRLGGKIRTDREAGELPQCYAALDETDEAQWVASEILKLTGEGRSAQPDIGVLYRVNRQSRAVEDALLGSGISYTVLSGRSFYARAEVRLAVSYLKLALDPDDDLAIEALLDTVPGVGTKRRGALREAAKAHGYSLFRHLSSAGPLMGIPRAVETDLKALVSRIGDVAARRKSSLPSVVEAAVEAVIRQLASTGDDTDSAREDLDELRALARSHHSARGTLRSFVDSLAMDSVHETGAYGVHLVSLHAAKGLEFSVVFLLGLEEGLLPHQRSLLREDGEEEERRLCYVGVTRARDRLYLSYARTRLTGGQGLSGQPSRFLGEMGSQNLTMRTSPVPRVQPRLPRVSSRERVRHSRWGSGTVENVEGKGRETLVTIFFDDHGRQRLQLCYAPLVSLGQERDDVAAG